MKKLATMAISVVLIACMVAGGSLAYLQDSDSDVNVMTLGEVKIEQREQERDADGNLVNFTQAKPLYPAVYSDGVLDWDDDLLEVNDGSYKVFDASMKNVLDKIVTVKNEGKSDAYVRTMIAFESPEGFNDDLLHINYNGTDTTMGDWIYVEIDGIRYVVTSFTYNEVLKAKTISAPSLLQVYLDPTATNDDVTACDGNNNGTYDIIVLSQAVQSAGFENAKTALDTAFGEANATNIAAWFGGTIIPEVVSNAEEFLEALAAGESIVLVNDIVLPNAAVIDNSVDIDLNGHTLTTIGLELSNGGSIENGTITGADNTVMTPHLKISGGTMEMNNVTVDVEHYLNANTYWSEAVGVEIANATAVLNDCDISIHNSYKARWVYCYGISVNKGVVTVNGGSITATCVDGTASNGPTNPIAICSVGDCTATLNDVDVNATYYGSTVQGHLTLNTTDKNITSSTIVDNRGGSHTLNYID